LMLLASSTAPTTSTGGHGHCRGIDRRRLKPWCLYQRRHSRGRRIMLRRFDPSTADFWFLCQDMMEAMIGL
jgi:hypothetical protein